MNEILRDHERVSVRLVMTPDRMVIDEARRTFTYLNLYGYLTDAVVVNRVFPPRSGDYFGAWREHQQEQLEPWRRVRAVPVLMRAVLRRGGRRGGDARPAGRGAARRAPPDDVLHDRVGELELGEDGRPLRLELPFASKGEISLKKLGPELIVRVNDAKRTMILPPAMDGLQPAGRRSTTASYVKLSFEAAHGRAPRATTARRPARASPRRRRRRSASPARPAGREAAAATCRRRAGRRPRTRRAPRRQALVALQPRCASWSPPSCARQLTEVIRQVLLLLRALIDWWIARLEREPPGAGEAPGHPDRLRRRTPARRIGGR